jgi:transcriptional regulator with XRE-family HTH domain
MINNQFARRNLALYVRGGLGLRLKEFYRLKAIENLRQSAELTNAKKIKLENTGSPISANPSNIPKINKIDTREEVSKAAGVSHDTISKIEEIKTAPIEVISDLERKLILSHSKPFC